jgi:hypothetical protein
MRKLTTGTFGIECKSVLPIRIMRGVHMRMIVKTISDKGILILVKSQEQR